MKLFHKENIQKISDHDFHILPVKYDNDIKIDNNYFLSHIENNSERELKSYILGREVNGYKYNDFNIYKITKKEVTGEDNTKRSIFKPESKYNNFVYWDKNNNYEYKLMNEIYDLETEFNNF